MNKEPEAARWLLGRYLRWAIPIRAFLEDTADEHVRALCAVDQNEARLRLARRRRGAERRSEQD
eukprot:scaffold31179_cov101-Isochrysis_galbana.AAC.6